MDASAVRRSPIPSLHHDGRPRPDGNSRTAGGSGKQTVTSIRWFRELEQAEMTVSMPRPFFGPMRFQVAHMAEHLMGRRLLAERCLADLTGRLVRDRITIRFVAPPARVDRVAAPGALEALVRLDGITPEVFCNERQALSVEDRILAAPLHSAGRLPADWSDFHVSWLSTEPVARLHRRPFLDRESPLLNDPQPGRTSTVSAQSEQSASASSEPRLLDAERTEARMALCQRLGCPPAFIVAGGPVRSHSSATSVLLAGLSAYRSPVFQQLRTGDQAIYSFNLFDFPWRRFCFIALVTLPPVDPSAVLRIWREAARTIAEMDAVSLRSLLFDGAVRNLRDLEATLASPQKSAGWRHVARLNGLSADPAAAARSVMNCRVRDLQKARIRLLARLDEEFQDEEAKVE